MQSIGFILHMIGPQHVSVRVEILDESFKRSVKALFQHKQTRLFSVEIMEIILKENIVECFSNKWLQCVKVTKAPGSSADMSLPSERKVNLQQLPFLLLILLYSSSFLSPSFPVVSLILSLPPSFNALSPFPCTFSLFLP